MIWETGYNCTIFEATEWKENNTASIQTCNSSVKAHFIVAYIYIKRPLFTWWYAKTDEPLPLTEFIPSQVVRYVHNCARLTLICVWSQIGWNSGSMNLLIYSPNLGLALYLSKFATIANISSRELPTANIIYCQCIKILRSFLWGKACGVKRSVWGSLFHWIIQNKFPFPCSNLNFLNDAVLWSKT